MTIKAFHQQTSTALLTIYSSAEAGLIAAELLEQIAGIDKKQLILMPEHILPARSLSLLNEAVADLLVHRPLQYITGHAWFYSNLLKVNEAVLIPRPETEELVEIIVRHIKSSGMASPVLLDIGTGSGCIPIALKKECPSTIIEAIDISEDALKVARENALTTSTEIKFQQIDFLEESQWLLLQKYNIIVSNPPYIPLAEKSSLEKNVTAYEPAKALFVPNEQPLLFYEKIAGFAQTHLHHGGFIFMELHEQFAKQTAALFLEKYNKVEILTDISGKERFLQVSY